MTVPAGLNGRLDGPAAQPAVDVVALVASAGGLDALTAVLRELPEDFPVAVIVAQHLVGRDLTPEEHVAESERQMERLARTGRIEPYEKELLHADGSRSRMLDAGAGMSDQTVVEYCIDLSPRAGVQDPAGPAE